MEADARQFVRRGLWVAMALLAGGTSCGPSPPSSPGGSFESDVAPLFATSCSFATTCHGDARAPQGGLFLGAPGIEGPALRAVYDGLVDVQASIAAMKRVARGDPRNSFLMRKLDGDQAAGVSCAGVGLIAGPCGDAMPQGGDPLPKDERDLVRRWIERGAPR